MRNILFRVTKRQQRQNLPGKFIGYGCLLMLVCLLPRRTHAQAEYESAGVIFQDAHITVELEFKLKPCGQTKSTKYRYRITGQPASGYRYLNFKMKYYNCDGDITCQPVSLNLVEYAPGSNQPTFAENQDWHFTGSKISVPFMDVKTSYSPGNEHSFREPLPVSMTAKSITGNTSIDYGDKTTLTVKGGGLGIQAKWIWYTTQCGGTPVDKGESITISPKENMVYYVRAESPTDTTNCVDVRVEVNTKSRAPSGIDGKSLICRGEQNIPLVVNGGKLGRGAKWVWYQDSCAGQPIGTGSRISVSPQKNTRYLVRAEGLDNTTACTQLALNIIEERSKDPEHILGKNVICAGEQLELQVTGGKLASDAEWRWYRNDIAPGNDIEKGERLYTKPIINTTYYVRAEGVCYTSAPRKIVVEVNSPSSQPATITATPGTVYSGAKVRLSVVGGMLGNNADWVWYKKNCEEGKRVGSGQHISTRVRKRTTFYVRAEGSCNTTSCIAYTITPYRKFEFFNIGVLPNFRTPAPAGGSTDIKGGVDKALAQKSYSVTFGQIKKSGWYLRAKYSFNSVKSSYTSNNDALLDYTSTANYYVFNGNVRENRLGVSGGLIFGITRRWLFMNLGIGYGKRELMWGIDEVSYTTGGKTQKWAKNVMQSYEGVELEYGLMIKCWILNVMVGGNSVFANSKDEAPHASGAFNDLYTGVGINF